MPRTIEVVLTKERTTPNTVRYKEVAEEGKPPVLKNLYLQDWVAQKADNLKVTIELDQ